MTKTKYFIDEDSKKVVCVINIPFTKCNSLCGSFKGVAKCSPVDEFDTATGCEIAYVRALLKLKKAEVQFHKNTMNRYDFGYNRYKKSQESYEYNKKRVKELTEELNTLLEED